MSLDRRRSIYREARLPAPARAPSNGVAAASAVGAAASYRNWYDSQNASPGAVQAFKNAWGGRSSWR